MELIIQKPGSHVCGQCCVAMLTGKTLKEVQKAMLAHKRGGTTPADLIYCLKNLGFGTKAGYHIWGVFPGPNDAAIVGLKSPYIPSHEWGGHWVVWNRGQILDPAGFNVAAAPNIQFTYVILVPGAVP